MRPHPLNYMRLGSQTKNSKYILNIHTSAKIPAAIFYHVNSPGPVGSWKQELRMGEGGVPRTQSTKPREEEAGLETKSKGKCASAAIPKWDHG